MPTTPSAASGELLTMDELAVLHASKSPIEIQEEHIRRAIAAGNRSMARQILEVTQGWTATTDDDVARLRGMILDSYDGEVAEAA